ncbi:MAG: putative ABC transporter permease [Eubacteriales bacterium]|nr:putative ABC transporter permease [Eubacteriales bacterium]
MVLSNYELIWLFFIYSFLGWILETVAAAFKQKRFVNKGMVNLPFCIIYGAGAVFITIFGKGLNAIWLYIGSIILIIVFKWIAGNLIEKIYHEKWWDYSDRPLNIDGYVSITDSALLAVLVVAMMKWGNPLLAKAFRIIPRMLGGIIIWTLVILMLIDITATVIAVCGKEHKAKQLIKIEHGFTDFTTLLGEKIYSHIEKRLKRAYPDAKKTDAVKTENGVFASGCCFYKLVWLFLIGSFLGDITETIFCRVTMGVWMSRSSVVWGDFSIVWGLAIVMATILLHRYRNKPFYTLFFAGTFLGGAYEYICSVFTEIAFGKVFWDYSHLPFNLGGRINLLFCFFWGIAAVVWIKVIYPKLSLLIEKIPVKAGKILSWVLIIFMCCNMAVSSLALIRSTQRKNDIPAEQGWQRIMDERFDDERIMQIYPNATNTY